MDSLPAPFRINPGLILWTLAVFLVLFVVLRSMLFPTIVKATVDREQRIKRDLEEAERLRQEAADLLAEQQKLLASARGEAQAILHEARQAGERERGTAMEKTRAEQEELLQRARREIEAERVRAIADIRRETVDIAIAAAGKVVGSRLDSSADRRIVEDYIASIGTAGSPG